MGKIEVAPTQEPIKLLLGATSSSFKVFSISFVANSRFVTLIKRKGETIINPVPSTTLALVEVVISSFPEA